MWRLTAIAWHRCSHTSALVYPAIASKKYRRPCMITSSGGSKNGFQTTLRSLLTKLRVHRGVLERVTEAPDSVPLSAAAPNEPYGGMNDPWMGKKLMRCRWIVLVAGHRVTYDRYFSSLNVYTKLRLFVPARLQLHT
ncbi:hypothetical protein M3J09_008509 [Ascochyta lentis]